MDKGVNAINAELKQMDIPADVDVEVAGSYKDQQGIVCRYGKFIADYSFVGVYCNGIAI